ncbi:MAG TPA: CDP-alcohol phosphatidyltransferase family protein [Gemmatimonadales bacterium]|nr:CDP-alcohol phosphatidyltransferase family protein [Gemmatimonadales bacterium]
MRPPSELALKGRGVEEWADIHFFRPAGIRVARALYPTRVTPDQVTLICLVIGLVAGHLMVYRSVRLTLLGVGLFLVSDIFDSADGQLARLRQSSTRFGRILDGVSDNLRFLNLYLHLMVRLLLDGWGGWAVALIVATGISHALQSAGADFMRHAFLEAGEGEGGELDLPEGDGTVPTGGFWRRVAIRAYRDYVARQARMFAASVALVRRIRTSGTTPDFRAEYRATQQRTITWCALIAQNIRFLVLLLTVVPGWPAGYCWVTIGPLNVGLLALWRVHEVKAGRLAGLLAADTAREVA